MQPDQNQQPTPDAGSSPTPEITPQPTVEQPTVPTPQPVVTPQPATPVATTPTPITTTPTVAPVTAQSTDPTQPGYIPPTGPAPGMVNTATATSLPATPGGKFNNGKLRLIIIIVVVLVSLSGAGILLKDTLFSGSGIKTSDLVEDEADGVKFKRPKQWTKSKDSPSSAAAYTEAGVSTKETDQALVVTSSYLGGNIDSLSSEQKAEVEKELQEQADKASERLGQSSSCNKISKSEASKIEHKNYPIAYKIVIVCDEIKGRNIKGEIRAVMGVKGSDLDLVMVVAVDKTWDKSGKALEEILTSFDHK